MVYRWARCHGGQVGEMIVPDDSGQVGQMSWWTGGRGDSVQMGQTSWCTGGADVMVDRWGRCHGVQVGQMSWWTGGADVMVDR